MLASVVEKMSIRLLNVLAERKLESNKVVTAISVLLGCLDSLSFMLVLCCDKLKLTFSVLDIA